VSEQPEDERRRRREFVEDLERQTEHARRLLDEIEEHRQEAEREGLNFTTLTAEQLKKNWPAPRVP
jgi:hypothetical protein